MEKTAKIPFYVSLLILWMGFTQVHGQSAGTLQGAWRSATGNVQEILLFQDGYFSHSSFDPVDRKFLMSRGGPYTTAGNKISVMYEFHSSRPVETGTDQSYVYSLKNNLLVLNLNGKDQNWTRVDPSSAPLAGVWKISERMEGGELVSIHQQGTRKTLKILTGTRFQWFAIDPGTKSFAGTGGGTYSFSGGKYTENIEFFSRDSSRVGASLSFDGKLEGGKWHHSGTSSRGAKIYEVWSRVYPATR